MAMARPSRIFIIDDHECDRLLMKEALSDSAWNAHIEEAETTGQAVNSLSQLAVKDEAPDLILVDYHINGENCMPLIAAIRGMPGFTETPIIVISAMALPEAIRERCYSLGVLRVLTKVFDYHSLLRMVRTLKTMLTGKGDISRGGSWISDPDVALLGES
jgi:CheY-like chemotaxis protein